MNRSENIAELTKAIIDFHARIGKVSKDSKNPFFKSNYASLPNILDTIQPVLNQCGLAVMQFPSGENGLTSVLAHTSGEFFEETYFMTPQKKDPQGQGSAITYQRRYALGAILNLNIDEDDDGNGASRPVNGSGYKNGKSSSNGNGHRRKKNTDDDGKEWLGEGTKHWDNAEEKIRSGEITARQLRDYYKVSKLNMEYFENLEGKRRAEIDEEFDNAEDLEGTPF